MTRERDDVPITLSLHCHGEAAKRAAGDLLRRFGDVGITALHASDEHQTHAVLFDRLDSALNKLLVSLSREGQARVIAVALDGGLVSGNMAWKLVRMGASEVLTWEANAFFAERVAARVQRWQEVDALVQSELVSVRAVGQSRAWLACLRRVVEAAVFGQGPLLLCGESGTGKELMAQLVHELDPRSGKGQLVVLDCTTVVPSLSGSEFFGHERGAFTGADGARDGAFALADRGTLFLDEIGELPHAMQAQLLRVVQERMYKRVGSNSWKRTNFRLVCATNRDLEAEIARGTFRADLFHRIARTRCLLPPLRERGDDVLQLATHFLKECCDTDDVSLDPSVERLLLSRAYLGNVRELRQLANRIGDRHVGPGSITIGDVPPEDLPDDVPDDQPNRSPDHAWQSSAVEDIVASALAMGVGLKELGRMTSETAIRLALQIEGGNIQRAAKLLKVTDRALQMRRAQQEPGDARPQLLDGE